MTDSHSALEFVVEIDDSHSRWEAWSAHQPGVAGVATASLADGVQFHVDALTGAPIGIEIEVDGERTEVLSRFIDGLPSARAGVNGDVLRLRNDPLDAVIRLALLEDCVRGAEMGGPASAFWHAELTHRREALGLRGLASSPTPDQPVATSATIERARDWVRRVARPLGRLSSRGTSILLDPGFIPSDLLDLGGDCLVVQDDSAVFEVWTPLVGEYAPQLAALSVVAIDESDTLVAVSGVSVGVGTWADLSESGPQVSGRARLAVADDRDRPNLRIVPVATIDRLPSYQLLERRSRARLAKLAARASRLGDSSLAREIWSKILGNSDGFHPYPGQPFWAELDV